MFLFKNKTINDLRNEILLFSDKEITTQGGQKVFIGEVEKLDTHYISSLTGMSFCKNGEFDWDKNIKGIKMFGFHVETHWEKGEYKISQKELVLVPYIQRKNKNFVFLNDRESILSNI